MKCPVCWTETELKTFNSFSYDYCPQCKEDVKELDKKKPPAPKKNDYGFQPIDTSLYPDLSNTPLMPADYYASYSGDPTNSDDGGEEDEDMPLCGAPGCTLCMKIDRASLSPRGLKGFELLRDYFKNPKGTK